MQVLLSHDAWEPVVGREMLWREHRLLLLAQPLLRSLAINKMRVVVVLF